MLEQTKTRLAELPAELADIAREMAAAAEVARLKEDLIPEETAVRVVAEHRTEDTEEWQRAVASAVAALAALDRAGYTVKRR